MRRDAIFLRGWYSFEMYQIYSIYILLLGLRVRKILEAANVREVSVWKGGAENIRQWGWKVHGAGNLPVNNIIIKL